MGTHPPGEMLPGTQVGLLQDPHVGGGGIRASRAFDPVPPCDGQEGQEGNGRTLKVLGLQAQLAALLCVSTGVL